LAHTRNIRSTVTNRLKKQVAILFNGWRIYVTSGNNMYYRS